MADTYQHLVSLGGNEEAIDAYLFESILAKQSDALSHFVRVFHLYTSALRGASSDTCQTQFAVLQRWLGLLFLKPTAFLEDSNEEKDVQLAYALFTEDEMMSTELLQLFVDRSLQDGQFDALWSSLFTYWRDTCQTIQLQNTSAWTMAFSAVTFWLQHPSLRKHFAEHPLFLAEEATDVVAFGKSALLVPLLSIGVSPLERRASPTANAPFASWFLPDMSDAERHATMETLRRGTSMMREAQHRLLMLLIRQGQKNEVTALLRRVINLNWDKAMMMQRNDRPSGSSALVDNLAAFACRAAQPVASKLHLIDADYFGHFPKEVDVSTQTRLLMTEKEAHAWAEEMAEPAETGPNFVSDIFFKCNTLIHFGIMNTLRQSKDVQRQLGHLQREVARMERMPESDPSDVRLRFAKEMAKKRLGAFKAWQASFLSVLYDEAEIGLTASTLTMTIQWLLGLCEKESRQMPYPDPPPKALAALPEFFVENILEFFHFYIMTSPKMVLGQDLGPVVHFAIAFLRSTSYTGNPYLKSKMIDLLYGFLHADNEWTSTKPILFGHPLALQELIPGCIEFYVAVESTGRSSQFYEKFNTRAEIGRIFKEAWTYSDFKEKFKEQSRIRDRFVRFVNMINNDTTYLLDESLSHLVKIRQFQLDMASPDFAKLTPEERQTKEEDFAREEGTCQSYLDLTNITLDMIGYLTTEIIDEFLVPEIVDRFAAMLNINLKQLVGPRSSELKVKNPEKYGFRPKELLAAILRIYVHLSGADVFVKAIARDGRSYSSDLFSKARSTVLRTGALLAEELQRLDAFHAACEKVAQEDQTLEEQMGDIPDHFLDPLMFTLMEDPVILPESKMTIDRGTITSHLLSDATDPFNRRPLSIDQVTPGFPLDPLFLQDEPRCTHSAG